VNVLEHIEDIRESSSSSTLFFFLAGKYFTKTLTVKITLGIKISNDECFPFRRDQVSFINGLTFIMENIFLD
jgi:hypothetical protein